MSTLPAALVTGASSGIGLRLAHELARLGHPLVVVSERAAELEQAAAELWRAHAVPVHPVVQDLAVPGAADALVAACDAAGLPVGLLVNNAGVLLAGPFLEQPAARVAGLMQLHTTTVVELCHRFGARFAARGAGGILIVSSISARMPYPVIALYGPSKGFLLQFGRALRHELRPHGVRVTVVLPGATDTALYAEHGVDRRLARRLGVMRSPERVARDAVRAWRRDRAQVVPGLLDRVIWGLLPLVPNGLIALAYRVWRHRR